MKALVLTVGTGDRDDLVATLFDPLAKSLADGQWDRVVLLPSSVSAPHAEEFRERTSGDHPQSEVSVRPLPTGAEEDADRSYEHFDAVLAGLLGDARADNIVVDFTRGTKAMSAAVVLAAVRHGVHELRYVTGKRDRRGTVRAGTESVRTSAARTVESHRRLDLSRALLVRGNYSAAGDVLRNLDGDDASAARRVAGFHAAWDRLDYRGAITALDGREDVQVPAEWRELAPTCRVRSWVESLVPNEGEGPPGCAVLQRLIADLLANGERRVAMGQFEDSLVRAYRVLELIGQARLLEHGLDSGDLDCRNVAVRCLQGKIRKKKQEPLRTQAGRLCAGRFQVARLLRILGDDLAEPLLDYDRGNSADWKSLLNPSVRNKSLLIHGFQAQAGSGRFLLADALRRLERLAVGGWGAEMEQHLKLARSIPFESASRAEPVRR